MAGSLLVPANEGVPIVPQAPPLDTAVAPNFEVFDGLEPLDNPAGRQRTDYYPGGPRPGQSVAGPDEFTRGPLSGVRGTVGAGQAAMPEYGQAGLSKFRAPGNYTPAPTRTVQWRLGVGQAGPSELGAAQTVALGTITESPPQPGDLTTIIAGWG